MTEEQARRFVASLGVAFAPMAARMDSTPEGAARRKLYEATIADAPYDLCCQLVRRILAGDHPAPEYPAEWDTFVGSVRRWARSAEWVTTRAEADDYDGLVRCLDCMDSGIVVTLSAAWIGEYWPGLDELPLPQGWMKAARAWCREHRAGPLTFAVGCYCDARRAEAERAKGRRPYDPLLGPSLRGLSPDCVAEVLADWVARNRERLEGRKEQQWLPA